MINKIDVIIPAYNTTDDNLFKCLASVACQSISKEILVTIVDDSSERENYAEVAKLFEKQLEIQIVKTPANGGCGVARQCGIDHTSNPYFTFLDTDDTLNGAFALEALRLGIESKEANYNVCVGNFDEVQYNPTYGPIVIPHDNDFTWMHGKLYRRSYIDVQNIRFHETSRANEDGGFNSIIKLMVDKDNQVKFIPARVYYWHENSASITRANNCNYAYGTSKRDSFFGYAENQIYAIKEVYKRQPNNPNLLPYSVTCMVNLYTYYLEVYEKFPENAPQNLEWCKWFYNEIYKDLEVPDEMFKRIYFECLRNKYQSNTFIGVVPELTFADFLKLLQ